MPAPPPPAPTVDLGAPPEPDIGLYLKHSRNCELTTSQFTLHYYTFSQIRRHCHAPIRLVGVLLQRLLALARKLSARTARRRLRKLALCVPFVVCASSLRLFLRKGYDDATLTEFDSRSFLATPFCRVRKKPYVIDLGVPSCLFASFVGHLPASFTTRSLPIL